MSSLIVEIPPAVIDLTRDDHTPRVEEAYDWGSAGAPPAEPPRLQRQNAMVSSVIDLTHDDPLVPAELFPVAAANVAEYVAGVHAHDTIINRVYFSSSHQEELYDFYHNYDVARSTNAEEVAHAFKNILKIWNDGAPTQTTIRATPLVRPEGNTWCFKSYYSTGLAAFGTIAIEDLCISEDEALLYMAYDYLKQTFVNPHYIRADTTGTPAAVAEINAILERQRALHLDLVSRIVK